MKKLISICAAAALLFFAGLKLADPMSYYGFVISEGSASLSDTAATTLTLPTWQDYPATGYICTIGVSGDSARYLVKETASSTDGFIAVDGDWIFLLDRPAMKTFNIWMGEGASSTTIYYSIQGVK